MNKSQKTVLVAAAIAGLVGGVVAQAKINGGNAQNQNVAGKSAPVVNSVKSSCNGCGGKTNKVSTVN